MLTIARFRNPSPKGFTIIEILIALFILAVGLLGFAGLQLASLSSSQEGFMRTQATQLAADLAARMRTNRQFINGTDNTNVYLANNVGTAVAGYTRYCRIGSSSLTEAAPADCVGGFCTNAQLAAFDRRAVCDALREAALPDGEIGIRCADRDAAAGTPDTDACSGYSRYTIYVGWQPNLKTDRGERVQNVAGPCSTEMGLTGTKSCVAVELVP